MLSFAQLLILSTSLAMDAVGVSTAIGIKAKKLSSKTAFKLALTFGFFQGFMPLLGWYMGEILAIFIQAVDHWVAFILLTIVGVKMIKESLNQSEGQSYLLSYKKILGLALATSIDALIVGFTLKYLEFPILFSALIIGIVTFLLCLGGYYFGRKIGFYLEGKVEAIGGAALILLGLKILFQHLR